MTRYILDTDHVTLLQFGHPEILQRARSVGSADRFITIVTVEEQIRGRLAVISQANQRPDRLEIAYTNLETTLRFFCRSNLLPFDQDALAHYRRLLQPKIRIGSQDLKIASIALANTAVVVTRNRKDFEKVPNLILEDWTIASGRSNY